VLKAKCDELESFKGNPEELQQTLALIETLTKQQQAAAALAPKKATQKATKPRDKFGSTEQPDLPHVELIFELDTADRACPSCGGDLQPMAGQFEESELIDFVEISYRVVQVKQQKYVCLLRRHGLEVTTQALWDQLSALGQRLAPTEAALFDHALTTPVIGLDQTGWPKPSPGSQISAHACRWRRPSGVCSWP
jgi:hypothetical protein